MARELLSLFALRSGHDLAVRVAARLGIALASHDEQEFDWGHYRTRPLADVRGHDVYVLESLHGDAAHSVNDKLCRLLFFLAALRDAGAHRLTVVVPFLCYSQHDRRTKAHDPVTMRYVAELFEAVGVDCVVTVEAHNLAAFQNAFRCETEHIDAGPLFADVLAEAVAGHDLAVVSPDPGGIKRAQHYRDALERRLGGTTGTAFIEKRRSQNAVSGDTVVGDVRDRTVILVDDFIATGTTLARAAESCRRGGASAVVAAAAHGAFGPNASPVLANAPIDRIFVLDHIPPTPLDPDLVSARLQVIDSSELLAAAIRSRSR